MGTPELANAPAYATRAARAEHADELYEKIAAWVATYTADDLTKLLSDAGIPASPLMNIAGPADPGRGADDAASDLLRVRRDRVRPGVRSAPAAVGFRQRRRHLADDQPDPRRSTRHPGTDRYRGRVRRGYGRPGAVADGDRGRALFRVAQETLANVAKHAGASKVGLTISYLEDTVVLDVRDDGVGFTVTEHSEPPPGNGDSGFGLNGLRQRLDRVLGTLTIESAPGSGTAINASVPAIRRGGGERANSRLRSGC